MSEYWKSTPKYWCKFCKTYVRDTKLERQQHDATPKHQGNIQRSLRDLHRNQEKDEREKQRAKDEVARLTGLVSGSGSSGTTSKDAPWKKKTAPPPPAPSAQATIEERKKQMKQLAEMGVAIPEEFRREIAMAGDWQVVSEKPINAGIKNEDSEDNKAAVNIGIRKRKFEGQEEEEEAGEAVVRKGWGSTFRTYPGSKGGNDDDLDSLLKSAKPAASPLKKEEAEDMPVIKKEESTEGTGVHLPSEDASAQPAVKAEEEAAAAPVVFKKRKKAAKQT